MSFMQPIGNPFLSARRMILVPLRRTPPPPDPIEQTHPPTSPQPRTFSSRAERRSVERFAFDAAAAFTPQQERLDGVTVAPLTRPLSRGALFQAAVFRIAAGGRIARHPASVPQILAVIDGSGEVSGGDGISEEISTGEAVYWAEGEEHETRTEHGLTALVLEGPGLAPFRRS
jgi:quercetin dioxygenase-like cupin family protein